MQNPGVQIFVWRISMLELKIEINEMDYADLLIAIMPHIDLSKTGLPQKLAGAVTSPAAIRTVLSFMPKDKQDELMISIIEKNKNKLIASMHKFAVKNKVRCSIADLSITKTNPDAIVI